MFPTNAVSQEVLTNNFHTGHEVMTINIGQRVNLENFFHPKRKMNEGKDTEVVTEFVTYAAVGNTRALYVCIKTTCHADGDRSGGRGNKDLKSYQGYCICNSQHMKKDCHKVKQANKSVCSEGKIQSNI